MSICVSTGRGPFTLISSHNHFFFSIVCPMTCLWSGSGWPELGSLEAFPGDHSPWSNEMEGEEEVVTSCFPLYSLVGTGAVSCWKEMDILFSTAESAPLFISGPFYVGNCQVF